MTTIFDLIATGEIEELIEQLASLAREQYGERGYTYRRISHNWSGARRRWFTAIGGDAVTQEVYEANVEQGKADRKAAGRGKLNKMQYYTYRSIKVRDGWRDVLIALIEEVPAGSPSGTMTDHTTQTTNPPAAGSAPVAGLGSSPKEK